MPRQKRTHFFRNLAAKRWKQEELGACESGGRKHEDIEAVDIPEDVENREDIVENPVEKTIRIREKLNLLSDKIPDDKEYKQECKYILLDFTELSPLLTNAKCADCGEPALRFALSNELHGFAHKLVLKCDSCKMSGLEAQKSEIYTSKRVENSKSTRPAFDVNLRLSTAFSYIGKGYAGIEQFAMIMNMQPFSETAFDGYSKVLESSVEKSTQIILDECRILAKQTYEKLDSEKPNNSENVDGESSDIESFEERQNEIDEDTEKDFECESTEINDSTHADQTVSENRADVVGNYGKENEPKDACVNAGVSYDGSWPTRGHKSKHGFGSVIDLLTGFVLDFEVVSKFSRVAMGVLDQPQSMIMSPSSTLALAMPSARPSAPFTLTPRLISVVGVLDQS